VVCLDATTLQITVANTGEWTEPVPREKTSHLGLQNLRRRLELLYPGRHRMDITAASGWVRIILSLPIL
jgi:LytS/YehU family sensor histidine kinase